MSPRESPAAKTLTLTLSGALSDKWMTFYQRIDTLKTAEGTSFFRPAR